jgi:outer membrane protein assembly factor BamB
MGGLEWRRHGRNERQTDALHCLNSTPVIDGSEIDGVDSDGELRGLDLKTGDRIWETFEPTSRQSARWGTAFHIRYIPFSGLTGEIDRAVR